MTLTFNRLEPLLHDSIPYDVTYPIGLTLDETVKNTLVRNDFKYVTTRSCDFIIGPGCCCTKIDGKLEILWILVTYKEYKSYIRECFDRELEIDGGLVKLYWDRKLMKDTSLSLYSSFRKHVLNPNKDKIEEERTTHIVSKLCKSIDIKAKSLAELETILKELSNAFKEQTSWT